MADDMTVIPAYGRQAREDPILARLDKAIDFFMLVRRYMGQGLTRDEALAAADRHFAPRPPGRAQQKGSLR